MRKSFLPKYIRKEIRDDWAFGAGRKEAILGPAPFRMEPKARAEGHEGRVRSRVSGHYKALTGGPYGAYEALGGLIEPLQGLRGPERSYKALKGLIRLCQAFKGLIRLSRAL